METRKFWESPLFQDMAKIVAGVLVLLVLVLSVLRPLVKSLIGPVRAAVSVLPRAAEPAPVAIERKRCGSQSRTADRPGPHPREPGSEARRAGRARLGGPG